MEDFVKAMQILVKYSKDKYPIHCEHDYLYFNIKWKLISKEDKQLLKKYGFFKDKEYGNGGIGSFRFGSC